MTTAADLVQLQETLYRSRNPTRRWLHCSRREWIGSALRRCRPPARDHALEVGPGSGIYLPLLGSLYREVVGSDIEQAYLIHAESQRASVPNLKLVRDDICNTSLSPQSFDCILCTEVIEHIEDSFAALQGMRGLLKHGGVLVLSTPQRYSPLELAAKIAFLPGVIDVVRRIYGEPILETGHINLMTAATVQRQLREAGFKIEHQDRTGMYLPVLAEFGGVATLRFENWLEKKIRTSFASGLLWTQYYIARAI